MKWKITGRFLIAIIATIIISLFSFLLINIFKVINYDMNSQEISSDKKGPKFTLDYGENIQYLDGDIFIEQDKINELEKYQSWIQVLDENGTEIYNRLKPIGAPVHYTPGKLIFYHKFSGAIEGNTIFVGIINRDGRELSYIMGFPENKISKAQLIYTPETILIDVIKVFISSLIVIIIISLIIGYLFSSFLSKPIIGIIKGIENLAKGDYNKEYRSKSVYKKVYHSLNVLSTTLQKNKIEREKIEKMREEWIINITHDIKTPLASIRGYSEILLDEDYDLSKNESLKYAQIIKSKSHYIGNLVEDLKLAYELNKPNYNIIDKEENLVNILRETIISILNHPKYQDKEINFNPQKDTIILKCDSILLQRAFSNLIYNAIIHNPDNTHIQIRVSEDKIIEIEDNGNGIQEEELDRLFDRYYRGTNTGEAHKGSGLGMAIAKQIIEAHRGRIEVISKLGEGTVIRIYFNNK